MQRRKQDDDRCKMKVPGKDEYRITLKHPKATTVVTATDLQLQTYAVLLFMRTFPGFMFNV